MNLDLVKDIGIDAARKGADVTRSFLGKTRIVKKGAIDLVTQADKESERIIINTILSTFPDHTILAEESGRHGHEAPYLWIIDPLDGTTNFAHEIQHYSVSIAFAVNGEIAVGIVLNPTSDELFTAVSGQGAHLNGRTISVSSVRDVGNSLLVTGFPYNFKAIFSQVIGRFSNCLKAAQGIRRFGSAALDLCDIACGRFDGFWEQNLHPWDTAAGCLIASEAGARISDFSNNPFDIYGNEILATNGSIHQEMISLLRIE
ncbi:MAG: inositol monophosphatase family protein [Desulfobacterales bacterium]